MIRSRCSVVWIFLAVLLYLVFLCIRYLDDVVSYYPKITQLRHQAQYGGSQGGSLTDPGKSQADYPRRACEWMPDTSNILIVMKTGASEAFARIPTQLLTTLSCVADFLIFSDMDQRIAGVNIYDSLDTVLKAAKDGNTDFDLYRHQQACAVDQESCNRGEDTASQGWNLDKYKNNHIAEKTYAMRPNYDWYIFVDADTYTVWSNLVQWLAKLDPSEKYYMGSVAWLNNYPFNHGGSGYVVSHAAMEDFVGKHTGIANKYDVETQKECCGDLMFSKALNDTTGMNPTHVWPTINGEKPYTLDFGAWQWCQPVATMHHMSPEEVSSFWEFEKRFIEEQDAQNAGRHPLTFKDIYHGFVETRLIPKRAKIGIISVKMSITWIRQPSTNSGSSTAPRRRTCQPQSRMPTRASTTVGRCAMRWKNVTNSGSTTGSARTARDFDLANQGKKRT